MKLCKAQAIPISIYQDRPVEMLKIAQNPTIRIPKISTATIRSAAVGPLLILNKHMPEAKKEYKHRPP